MEVIEALKAENASLKDLLKNVNAEKIAIDQMYLASLKEILQLRTKLVLSETKEDKAVTPEVVDKEVPVLEVIEERYESSAVADVA